MKVEKHRERFPADPPPDTVDSLLSQAMAD